MKTTPHLASRKICTGCTACYSVCPNNSIRMVSDQFGFLYPKIDAENCVGCLKCEKSCPVCNPLVADGIEPMAYAAYSLNEKTRMNSSSGGIFGEIANHIIEQNGYVYGAAYTDDFVVKHCGVNSREKLTQLQGAKYSQSVLDQIFLDVKRHLLNAEKVLFVGTPCQIYGLKAFLNKSYDNLFTVDFVCYGIPSPVIWRKYVQYRSCNDNSGEFPKMINLRSKETGWREYKYSILFQYSKEKKYSALNGTDLYSKLFVSNCINRESCSECHFKGINRISDLTLADFWGIWDILPEMDDDRGTSAVIAHSEEGIRIINAISDKLKIQRVEISQVMLRNPSLIHASKLNRKRNRIMRMIIKGKMSKVENMLEKKKDKMILEKVKRGLKFVQRKFIR